MPTSDPPPRPKRRISLHVTLLTLLAVSVVVVVGLSLAVVYREGRRAADDQAAASFDLATSSVEQRIASLLGSPADVVEVGASRSLLSQGVPAPDSTQHAELIETLAVLLSTSEDLYSVYQGTGDGDFVQLVALGDTALREQFGAPDAATAMFREVVVGPDGEVTDRRRFLDDDLDDVGSPQVEPATYDPRERPWYVAADAADALVLTAPYVFDSTGAPGVTLAKASPQSSGVFGADLTLTTLQDFVAELAISDDGSVYLFDASGQLWTAHLPDGRDLGVGPVADVADSTLDRLVELAASASTGTVEQDGQLERVSGFSPPAGDRLLVGLSAPRSDFTGFVAGAARRIALLLPIVLLVGFALIWWVARSISRPVRALDVRAQRVATFVFDEAPPERSAITEVDSLGESFGVMTDQLREHIHALAAARRRLETLVDTGIALTSERDPELLLDRFLADARTLTQARIGLLYDVGEDGVVLARATGADGDGERPVDRVGVPSAASLAALAAGERTSQHIHGDVDGVVWSRLAVPVLDRSGAVDVVAVLVDATDIVADRVVPFHRELVGFVAVAASQASAALDGAELVRQQQRLIDGIIKLIAGAIDAKSPYTAGHCNRVPQIAVQLADAASASRSPALRAFTLDDAARDEFRIAAWLHDCGKVTTPEYVVDKATKLETIHNRIHEIRTRFEVLYRDVRISALEAQLAGASESSASAVASAELARLREEFAFVAASNLGGEWMTDEEVARIEEIAAQPWLRYFDDRLGLSRDEAARRDAVAAPPLPATERLLADQPWHRIPRRDGGEPWGQNPYGYTMTVPAFEYDLGEITNLCIRHGTLTAEERFKINDHIVQTINMLEQLPFPPHLARVPEIAGGHHETMIGTGYPKGLTREQLSIPARIVAIADVFEALTAGDRPYKPAKTVSESLAIMASFRDRQHLDADLFDLFLVSGIVDRYADEHLDERQRDDFDVRDFVSTRRSDELVDEERER